MYQAILWHERNSRNSMEIIGFTKVSGSPIATNGVICCSYLWFCQSFPSLGSFSLNSSDSLKIELYPAIILGSENIRVGSNVSQHRQMCERKIYTCKLDCNFLGLKRNFQVERPHFHHLLFAAEKRLIFHYVLLTFTNINWKNSFLNEYRFQLNLILH